VRGPYKHISDIPAPSGSTRTIQKTQAVMVKTAGVVVIGSQNGALVNLGTLAAGTVLDGVEVTQVGTATTAGLVALR